MAHLTEGRAVRIARALRNVRQGHLARAMGVSQSLLSRIESGDRPLQPAVLTALVEATGIGRELVETLAGWRPVDHLAARQLLQALREEFRDNG